MITRQLPCAAASAAPHSPPTRAWLELVGKPTYQVSKSQAIAPNKAQISVTLVKSNSEVSTNPPAMVLATAVQRSAPIRLVVADKTMAWRGLNTLVDTTVAMELAVSWNPLMYSNTRATRMTTKMSVMAA